MEPLPKGANFVRGKTLWEIGLHIAGNPDTPYGGNRDMVITIGSGSGASFARSGCVCGSDSVHSTLPKRRGSWKRSTCPVSKRISQ